jgi:Uma2 family endonuclease
MSRIKVAPEEIIYPSSDGKPVAETEAHILLLLQLVGTLKIFLRPDPMVYAIGNMFLYYEEGNPRARRAPDVMVIKGVDGRLIRRSFKTWVEKAVPCCIIEVTSKKTAKEDLVTKRDLYERLRVHEYFLYDPLHEYLPQQLMGFRLGEAAYQAMTPAVDGSLLSDELGLRFVAEGIKLGLFRRDTGERVPLLYDTPELLEEARAEIAAQKSELLREKQDSRKAMQRAEREQKRAEQEKQRADALATELARLKAQLGERES